MRRAGVGAGEHPAPALEDPAPRKREGDGRAPAGVFRIGPVWTRATAAGRHCVDDPRAADYGRVIRLAPGGAPRWRSAGDLTMYRVAVTVEHNGGRLSGAGSCIFLHDGVASTVGCTAFAPAALDAMCARLRPGARLVQLPVPGADVPPGASGLGPADPAAGRGPTETGWPRPNRARCQPES